jgi:hypothetical protein
MELDQIATRLGLKDEATFAAEVEQRYLAKIQQMRYEAPDPKRTLTQTNEMIIAEIQQRRQSGKTTRILMSVIKNLLDGKTSAIFAQSYGVQKATYAKLAEMLRFFPEIQLDICQGFDIVVRTINGPKFAVRICLTRMDHHGVRFDEIFWDDCKEQK